METAKEKIYAAVFRVGIVTLSDKGYQGEREDKSGPRDQGAAAGRAV